MKKKMRPVFFSSTALIQGLLLMLVTSAGVNQGLYAQITLSYTDLVNTDTLIWRGIDYFPDSTTVPGNPGFNVWDFSKLLNRNLDTVYFLNPALTPFYSKFPDANLCMLNNDGYTYFNKNSSQFSLEGTATDILLNGTLIPVKVTPPLSIVKFPANYMDVYEDSSMFNEVIDAKLVGTKSFDYIMLTGNVKSYVKWDAYGIMDTPFGTMNVLRQTVTETIHYTITGKKYFLGLLLYSSLLSEEVETELRYHWWTDTPYVGYPVVEIQINSLGAVQSVKFAVALNVDVKEPIMTFCHDSCDAMAGVSGADTNYQYLWYDTFSQTNALATGLCSGSYIVKVTDSTGSYVNIPFYIGNHDELSGKVSIFGASCLSCADGSIYALPTGGEPPYTFQWDSAAGYSTSALVQGLAIGNYSVAIMDNNGCTVIVAADLGLFTGIKIYPNPAYQYLFVKTRTTDIKKLIFYDTSGRMVWQVQIASNDSAVPLGGLPQGLYLYKLVDENGKMLKSGRLAIMRH